MMAGVEGSAKWQKRSVKPAGLTKPRLQKDSVVLQLTPSDPGPVPAHLDERLSRRAHGATEL